MEFKFSGIINFDDFMKFQQYNLRNDLNKIWPKNGWIISLCFLVFYFIMELRREYSLQKIIIWVIIITLIGSVLLILYYSKDIYKKLFENDKSNKEECNYTINENNIIIEYKNGIINFNKENIYKILFDDDAVYIYEKPNIAKIIKTIFIANKEIYDELVIFIKDKYKNTITN